MDEALKKMGEDWEKEKRTKIPLEQLIRTVASHFKIMEVSIISASRKRDVCEARGIICCLAVNDFGYSTAEVGRALGRRVSAGQCVVRGGKILDRDQNLRHKFAISQLNYQRPIIQSKPYPVIFGVQYRQQKNGIAG